jgi:hypothetical protein
MPAYNFQQRFAEPVELKVKRQTIRARRRDGREPKVGQLFVGYTGLRTKASRLLCTSSITEVMPIEISATGIRLGGRLLSNKEANDIAIADGFAHINEMIGWFIATHGRGIFHGHLIRWR